MGTVDLGRNNYRPAATINYSTCLHCGQPSHWACNYQIGDLKDKLKELTEKLIRLKELGFKQYGNTIEFLAQDGNSEEGADSTKVIKACMAAFNTVEEKRLVHQLWGINSRDQRKESSPRYE